MKETKETLNEGEIGEWKCWPKTQHSKKQKLWHLVLWAPKSLQMVTAAMKLRHLLLGRIATSNLESILKSRDNPLPTKVCIVKAMVFPVVMYECEHWTIKKSKCPKNLSTKELTLSNCGAGGDSWDSLEQQGDQISQF